MFLQRYVHVVLDAVLGSYVKNIDPKALQISVWNGKIEVETVELQPDAFPLPKQMRLVKGTLRQLRIDLPWTNLASQPIRVDIQDVSLLLEVCADDRAASDATEVTPEELRRAARKKQQKLQRKRAAIDAVEKATEFNEQNSTQTAVGQSWTQSFLCKLLAKALDNVQVHVQHLHVRMEDAVSDPKCPYAVGMTLEAIIIKSADEGWNYTMVGRGASLQHGMSFIRKKVDVNKFGIYWSLPLVPVPETALSDAEAFAALMTSNFEPIKKKNKSQVVEPVLPPLAKKSGPQDTAGPALFKSIDYLVHPLTVSMKLTVNDGDAKLPITHQELSERVLSRIGTSWMVETIDAIGDDAWNDFLKTMPKLAGERKYTLGFVFSEAWSVARDLTEEEDEIPSVLHFKRALSSCMQWSLEEVNRVEQCIVKYREAVVHVMEEKSTYIDAQASIDQINTSLHRQQYLSALSFISFFTVMRRQTRYLALRPNRIRVRNNPRAWWRYAINAVLLDVRERLAHVDWEALEKKQRQKDRYKALCILVEHSATAAATLVPMDVRLMSKEMARSELDDLEYVMDVQELIKLRRTVRKEIADKENEKQILQSKGEKNHKDGGHLHLDSEVSTGSRLWSYASWLTGAGGAAHGSGTHGAGGVRAEDVKWSEQDANDLYEAIDFHPDGKKESRDSSSNEIEDVARREKQYLQNHQHILYRFQLALHRASFELSLENAHTDACSQKGSTKVETPSSSCLTASLDDVEIQFLVRPSSLELGLQLRDALFCQGPRLSIHDESSPGKRSTSLSGKGFFLQRMDINEVVEYHPVGVQDQMSSVRLRHCEKELPLVQLSIESVRQCNTGMASDAMNANEDDVQITSDVALPAHLLIVSLVTQPIRCNVNLMFLLDVVAVFSRPVNVDLSGLEHSAWKKAQSLQRSSAAQLRDALARRTMVEVRLDVISPLINIIQATLPDTGVSNSDEVSLLVFLGHLQAQTKHPGDAINGSRIPKELGDYKMGTNASQMAALAPSEESLYDVLEISVSGIEVQIIDGENSSGGNRVFLSRIHSRKKSAWQYLLEKTSLTFNFYMSVTPDDPSIPLLKLSGGVDQVKLNLSATSFRSLVQLLHSFGENLSLYARRRMGRNMTAAADTTDHPARGTGYLATAASRCSKPTLMRKALSYIRPEDADLSNNNSCGRFTTASDNSPYTGLAHGLARNFQLERQKTFREKEIDDNDLLKLWKRVVCQLQFGIGKIILTLQVRDRGNGSGKIVRVLAIDISTRLQVRSYDRRLDFALGTLLVEDILLSRSSSSSKVVETKRCLMKSGNHEVVTDPERKSTEEPVLPPSSSEQLIHVAITGIASDAVMLKDKQLWKRVRHSALSSSSGKDSVWQDPLITALSVDASLRVLKIDVYQDTLADVFVFFFGQSKEDGGAQKQALRPPLLSLRSISEGSTPGRSKVAASVDEQSVLSPVDDEVNENTFSRKLGVWVTSSFLDNHLGASPKKEDEQQATVNNGCGSVEENRPASMQSRLHVEGLSLYLHLDDKQRPEGMPSAFASLTAQQFCCCVQRFPLYMSIFAYLNSFKIYDVSQSDQHFSEIVSHGVPSAKRSDDKVWNTRDATCEYDGDIAVGHVPTQCEILNLLDHVPAVFSCAMQSYGVDAIQEAWHPGYSSRYTVRLKSPRIRFLYSFVDDMCNYWMKGVLLTTVQSILSREQTDTHWEGDFQLAGIQGSPALQVGDEREEDAKSQASSSKLSGPDVVSMFPLVDIHLEDAVLEMPPHRMSLESLLVRFDTFRASNKGIVDSFLGMENRVVAKVLLNSSLKQLQLDMKALRIVSVIFMERNDMDKRLENGGLITQSLLGLTNYSLSVDFRSHVDIKVSMSCSPVRLVCNQDQYAFVLRVPFQNYRERTRYSFYQESETPVKVAARVSSRRFFLHRNVDGLSSSSGRAVEDGDEASDGTSASGVPEVIADRHIMLNLHVPEVTMEILQGQRGYHPSSSGDLDMAEKSKMNDASICLLALFVLSARADLVNQRLTADVDLEGVHIRDSRVQSKMSASYRDVVVFERCKNRLPKVIKLQLVRESFDVDVSTVSFDPHGKRLQASRTRFRSASSRASVGLFGSELSLRRTDSEISAHSSISSTVANRGMHTDRSIEKEPPALVGVEERIELVIDVAGFKVIPSNIHYDLIRFLTSPPSWGTEDVNSVSRRGTEEKGRTDLDETTVLPPTYRRISLELNLGPSAFLFVEDPHKLKSRAIVLSWESSLILNYLRQTNEDECSQVEGISKEYPAHSRNQLQFCVALENIYATSRLSEESIWAAEQAATAASADCLKPIGMESVFQIDLRSHFLRFQTTFDRVMELRFGYLDFCTMLAAFEHILRRPSTASQSSAHGGQNRRSMSGSSISSLSGGGADSETTSWSGRRQSPSSPRSNLALFMSRKCERQCAAALYGTSLIYLVSASFRGRLETRPVVGFYNSTWRKRYLVLPYTAQQRQLVQSVAFRILPASESRRQIGDEVYYGDRIILEAVVATDGDNTEGKSSKDALLSKEEASDASPTASKDTAKLPHSTLIQKYDQLGANGYLGPEGSAGVFETTIWKHGSTMFNSDKSVIYDRELIVFEEVTIYRSFSKGKTFGASNDAGQQMDFNSSRSGHQAEGAHTVDATSARGGGYLMFNGVGDAPIPFALSIVSGTSGAESSRRQKNGLPDADDVHSASEAPDSLDDASDPAHVSGETPAASAKSGKKKRKSLFAHASFLDNLKILEFTLPGVNATIVNDFHNMLLPLLHFRVAALNADIRGRLEYKFTALTSLRFGIQAYNSQLAVWEPVLEDFEMNMAYHGMGGVLCDYCMSERQSVSPTGAALRCDGMPLCLFRSSRTEVFTNAAAHSWESKNYIYRELLEQPDVQDGAKLANAFMIVAKDDFNINVSRNVINVLVHFFALVTEVTAADEALSSRLGPFIYVDNQSGIPFVVATHPLSSAAAINTARGASSSSRRPTGSIEMPTDVPGADTNDEIMKAGTAMFNSLAWSRRRLSTMLSDVSSADTKWIRVESGERIATEIVAHEAPAGCVTSPLRRLLWLKPQSHSQGITSSKAIPVPIGYSNRSYLHLESSGKQHESWHGESIICETVAEQGTLVLRLRGKVQLTNFYDIPIQIIYNDQREETIEPGGMAAHYIPIQYLDSGSIAFRPLLSNGKVQRSDALSIASLLRSNDFTCCGRSKRRQNVGSLELRKALTFYWDVHPSTDVEDGADATFDVSLPPFQVILTALRKSERHETTITLRPPIVLENLVPYELSYRTVCMKSEAEVVWVAKNATSFSGANGKVPSGSTACLAELDILERDLKNGEVVQTPTVVGLSLALPQIELRRFSCWSSDAFIYGCQSFCERIELNMRDDSEAEAPTIANKLTICVEVTQLEKLRFRSLNTLCPVVCRVFTEYWLIDRTSLSLAFYTADDYLIPSNHPSRLYEGNEDADDNSSAVSLSVFSCESKQVVSKMKIGIKGDAGEREVQSEPFDISAVGVRGQILVPTNRSRDARYLLSTITEFGALPSDMKSTFTQYEFGVMIEQGPEKFLRSRVVTLVPRYYFINTSSKFEIHVRQERSTDPNAVVVLLPKESKIFHWSDSRLPHRVQVCFVLPDKRQDTHNPVSFVNSSQWTAPFELSSVGNFVLRVKSKVRPAPPCLPGCFDGGTSSQKQIEEVEDADMLCDEDDEHNDAGRMLTEGIQLNVAVELHDPSFLVYLEESSPSAHVSPPSLSEYEANHRKHMLINKQKKEDETFVPFKIKNECSNLALIVWQKTLLKDGKGNVTIGFEGGDSVLPFHSIDYVPFRFSAFPTVFVQVQKVAGLGVKASRKERPSRGRHSDRLDRKSSVERKKSGSAGSALSRAAMLDQTHVVTTFEVQLKKLQCLPTIDVSEGATKKRLWAEVLLDETTKTLLVTDMLPGFSGEHKRRRRANLLRSWKRYNNSIVFISHVLSAHAAHLANGLNDDLVQGARASKKCVRFATDITNGRVKLGMEEDTSQRETKQDKVAGSIPSSDVEGKEMEALALCARLVDAAHLEEVFLQAGRSDLTSCQPFITFKLKTAEREVRAKLTPQSTTVFPRWLPALHSKTTLSTLVLFDDGEKTEGESNHEFGADVEIIVEIREADKVLFGSSVVAATRIPLQEYCAAAMISARSDANYEAPVVEFLAPVHLVQTGGGRPRSLGNETRIRFQMCCRRTSTTRSATSELNEGGSEDHDAVKEIKDILSAYQLKKELDLLVDSKSQLKMLLEHEAVDTSTSGSNIPAALRAVPDCSSEEEKKSMTLSHFVASVEDDSGGPHSQSANSTRGSAPSVTTDGSVSDGAYEDMIDEKRLTAVLIGVSNLQIPTEIIRSNFKHTHRKIELLEPKVYCTITYQKSTRSALSAVAKASSIAASTEQDKSDDSRSVSSGETSTAESPSNHAHLQRVRTHEFLRGQTLGLDLVYRNGRVLVQGVVCDGPCGALVYEGKIRIGDTVVAVNKKSIVNLHRDASFAVIEKAMHWGEGIGSQIQNQAPRSTFTLSFLYQPTTSPAFSNARPPCAQPLYEEAGVRKYDAEWNRRVEFVETPNTNSAAESGDEQVLVRVYLRNETSDHGLSASQESSIVPFLYFFGDDAMMDHLDHSKQDSRFDVLLAECWVPLPPSSLSDAGNLMSMQGNPMAEPSALTFNERICALYSPQQRSRQHSALEMIGQLRLALKWDFINPLRAAHQQRDLSLHFQLEVARICISVVDDGAWSSMASATGPQEPREVLCISLSDQNASAGVQLSYGQISDGKKVINARIGHFQIDNQLLDTNYPVLLRPIRLLDAQMQEEGYTMARGEGGKESVESGQVETPMLLPTLQLMAVFSHQPNVVQFDYIFGQLQELEIKLEDATFVALAHVFSGVKWSHTASASRTSKQSKRSGDGFGSNLALKLLEIEWSTPTLLSTAAGKRLDSTKSGGGANMKVLLRWLLLCPVKVNVTFTSTADRSLLLSLLSPDMSSALSTLISAAAALVSNLDQAPIRIPEFYVENLLETTHTLAFYAMQHYLHHGLRSWYSIMGSVDFLGNPIGLVSTLGTGVKDFFYTPAQMLLEDENGLRIDNLRTGMTKGSKSLLRNTAVGIFHTTGKITETLGKGVALLAMDEQYYVQRQRASTRQIKKINDIGDAIAEGSKGLVGGIWDGIKGVVAAPVRGAEQDGASGFVVGIGKGVAGLIVKPTAGFLDLLTSLSRGAKTSAQSLDGTDRNAYDVVTRFRLPRRICSDGVLVSYSEREARGYAVLLLTPLDATDDYVYHVDYGIEPHRGLLLLTDKRLICLSGKTGQKLWEIALDSTLAIVVEGATLKIGQNTSPSRSYNIECDSEVAATNFQVAVDSARVDVSATRYLLLNLEKSQEESRIAGGGRFSSATTGILVNDEDRTDLHVLMENVQDTTVSGVSNDDLRSQPLRSVRVEVCHLQNKDAHANVPDRAIDKLLSFSVFLIQVYGGPYQWTVFRRFSEFREMYAKLEGAGYVLDGLPLLPPRTFLPSTRAPVAKHRQEALNMFLQAAIMHSDISRSAAMLDFLTREAREVRVSLPPLSPAGEREAPQRGDSP